MPLNKRCVCSNMDISAAALLQLECRGRESMRRIVLGLFVLAVCGMMVAPMGMAGKPQPPPTPPPEPTGNLIITSNPQLVFGTGAGYVRLYDWVNSKFSHTWSGGGGNKVVIGDVDNDGAKEVVSRYIDAGTGIAYFRVWNNGDGSNSPSITVQMPSPTCDMEIGDVDKDGSKELVISGTDSQGSAEVWSCTNSACTKEATIPNLGYMDLTVADADNDGYAEIMMGQGIGTYSRQPVIVDYNNVYSITPLPMRANYPVVKVSVGNIDGTSGNELFSIDVNDVAHIWKYSILNYIEIWSKQLNDANYAGSTIADIDGDGNIEIAFPEYCILNHGRTTTGTLRIYKYDGSNSWSQSGAYDTNSNGLISNVVSADVDRDGAKELVVGNQVWNWDVSAMKLIQTIDSSVSDSSIT